MGMKVTSMLFEIDAAATEKDAATIIEHARRNPKNLRSIIFTPFKKYIPRFLKCEKLSANFGYAAF
jgi:hypothetical protein